jgi:hypothetical protein
VSVLHLRSRYLSLDHNGFLHLHDLQKPLLPWHFAYAAAQNKGFEPPIGLEVFHFVQHVSRPLVTIFDSPLICTASCAQALLMLDVPEQQAAGHHFIETKCSQKKIYKKQEGQKKDSILN